MLELTTEFSNRLHLPSSWCEEFVDVLDFGHVRVREGDPKRRPGKANIRVSRVNSS